MLLDHGIAREGVDKLGEGLAGVSHEVEDHGHGEEGVANVADAGVDDAAVAFAADDGLFGEEAFDDVDFTDGSAKNG